jgi:ribosomal-protein-alanine N-acetyltransferase
VLFLETDRLIIRDAGADDLQGFFDYMSQEDYWHHVPVEPVTVDSVKAMVRHAVRAQSQDPRTGYFLAVMEKQSNKLVGEAILHVRSARWRQGEIGWGVSRDHMGNGLATEIGFAMMRFAFDTLRLHRVYAQCRVENAASRRIMAKLGMRQEGVLRENVLAREEWWSSVQCAILSTEWRG